MNIQQWLDSILMMHPSEIKLGLERVNAVAQRMKLSLESVVITVAGTNGKGSVCAYLESIALQAGYQVATYTSPHFIDFNERARINGVPVPSAQLIAAFEQVQQARGDEALTYFEFTTLAVLSVFAQARPDLTILEVGMGGRLDAVNIIDADCAIVTCIDLDHTSYLGTTREQIGWEKAHVYRAGAPAICADPVPPASIAEHAKAIGADLWQFGRDFNYAGDRQQWSYRGRSQRRSALAYPALRGANQLLNASAALAAFEALKERLPIAQKDVRQGLAQVSLPGRFQILPGQPAVVLDMAHNPHAVAHLAANLDNMGFFPYTYAVFGVMADKELDKILDAVGDRVDHWLVTELETPRAASAQSIAERLAMRSCVVVPAQAATQSGAERTVALFDSPRQALTRARELAGVDDRIVVFGSAFTVGDILASMQSKPDH